MGYINEMFKRVNIQHLREFILNEVEATEISTSTYNERLDGATASMYVRLENLYSDEEEREDAINDFNFALSAYTDVHIEIGMKLGARLLNELLLLKENTLH